MRFNPEYDFLINGNRQESLRIVGTDFYIYKAVERTYQDLQWIESDGTNYIDTGIHGTTFANLSIDLEWLDIVGATGSNNVKYAFGYEGWNSSSSSTSNRFAASNYSTNGELPFGSRGGLKTYLKQNAETRLEMHWQYYGDYEPQWSYKCYRNGSLLQEESGLNNIEYAINNHTFWVFASNLTNTAPQSNRSKMRLKSLIIETEPLSDSYKETYIFTPCKRTSDNAVGLLDKDRNVFYTSPIGNSFVAGPVIP